MMTYRDEVADVAYAAATAHVKQGARSWLCAKTGAVFNLVENGYCARFVRMTHECAEGLDAFDWPYSAPDARAMEAKLKANGRACEPSPGAVIAMNGTSYSHGHIGIYLGEVYGREGLWIAENTSSTSRGPGTVISPLSAVAGIVTGYYSALSKRPAVLPDDGRVVILPGSDHWVEARMVTPGAVWVPLSAFLDAAHAQGLATDLAIKRPDHWADTRRVYVHNPAGDEAANGGGADV